VFVALGVGNFFLIKIMGKVLVARDVHNLPLAAIITFALCEAVGLLGLVLFLLTGNSLDFYIFMFLSLFYFWLYFPKYQDWEAQVSSPKTGSAK